MKEKATTIKGVLTEIGKTSVMIADNEYLTTERTREFVNEKMVGKEVEARIENEKVTFITLTSGKPISKPTTEKPLKNFLRKWLAPRDEQLNQQFEEDLKSCFE